MPIGVATALRAGEGGLRAKSSGCAAGDKAGQLNCRADKRMPIGYVVYSRGTAEPAYTRAVGATDA